MTMRMSYRDSKKAATAAFRAVTGRVARGYWPIAEAMQQTQGLNAGQWILHVVITHDKPPRPSDAPRYEFEIRCDTEGTARGAVQTAHDMFYRQMNEAEAEKRSGKVEPIGKMLKRKYGEEKK